MSTTIQIRNVPEALHRQLKSRAASAGVSLSDYLLSEIRQAAERPTADELRARLRSRTQTAPSVAHTDREQPRRRVSPALEWAVKAARRLDKGLTERSW
jgi:plasmid stability protein